MVSVAVCESSKIVWGCALSIVAALAMVVKASIVFNGGRSFIRIRCESSTFSDGFCGEVMITKRKPQQQKFNYFCCCGHSHFITTTIRQSYPETGIPTG
jgi:hypothetical protein